MFQSEIMTILLCNEMGDVLIFCLSPASVDDRAPRVWKVFT